jgi:hypothetical protein
MGVHDIDKYPAVKAMLDIPDDEPIFILRGKDKLAFQTIMNYQSMAVSRRCPEAFIGDLDKVLERFEEWQDQHSELMKLPD